MAPSKRIVKEEPNTITIPTDKAVVAMVRMILSEDEKLKPIALEMAGFIVEAYDDKEMLKRDVLGAFVGGRGKPSMFLIPQMKNRYPDELETLKDIFGQFLFGEDK